MISLVIASLMKIIGLYWHIASIVTKKFLFMVGYTLFYMFPVTLPSSGFDKNFPFIAFPFPSTHDL